MNGIPILGTIWKFIGPEKVGGFGRLHEIISTDKATNDIVTVSVPPEWSWRGHAQKFHREFIFHRVKK